MAAKNTVTITGNGGLDCSSFKNFAKALRKAEPALAVELRESLRGAGTIAAEAVKANSSWSTRIPGSVKVRVSSATVSVIAGGKAAPDAEPYENSGKEGNFRHPVPPGRSVWVNQKARPFFKPAVVGSLPAVESAAVDALDAVVQQIIIDTEV
jgi:hypothetical protein